VTHMLADRQRLPSYSAVPAEMLEARQSYTGEDDSFIPRAVVHRLDRGTTGALLLAKSSVAEAHFAAQFKGRTTQKRYVALLQGRPSVQHNDGVSISIQPDSGLHVSAPIGRDPTRPGKMKVDKQGKAAYSVVYMHAYSSEEDLCLVSVELLSGRTHQIRVHCAECLGAPLINDEMYDMAERVAAARRRFHSVTSLARGRPLLHAWSLQLPHLGSMGTLAVRAPLPADMCALIESAWPGMPSDEPSAWPLLSLDQL